MPPLAHVVLVHPEIPQNTGNIGRTCVAVGAKLWIVRPAGFRLDAASLRRAGLDYWQYLAWEAVPDWQTLTARLAGHRFWYFSRHARRELYSVEMRTGDCLVFGSETGGLPDSVMAAAGDTLLRLPTSPRVRSLNLATTAGVALYELVRQVGGRTIPQGPVG